MNYLKRMNGTIRNEAAGKGLITGALISAALNVLMMTGGFNPGFFGPVLFTVLLAAVCALIAILFSIRRTGALTRRIRSLEKISGSIDNDTIRAYGEEIAMGDMWLISKSGTQYKAWTKDILKSMTLESNNPQAKKAVLILDMANGRQDKCIVTKSAGLERMIQAWQPQPESEDLTFGQM